MSIESVRRSFVGVQEWPEPDAAMFQGIAGEFVRMVAPGSEADLVAVLTQFLAAVGCYIGSEPHFEVEGAEHPARLNVIVVGQTAHGRKQTAWNLAAKLLREVDPEFVRNNVKSGLSSGEGLIWQVRDPVVEHRRVKGDQGGQAYYEDNEVDPGVADKRLVVLEEEFAQVLAVIERPGNTLSPVVRAAWDRGDLSSLTKNSPARATGAHVSIIGHITPEELEHRLSTTEAGNGFANRFLFVCSRRSKVLPRGGALDGRALGALAVRLRALAETARKIDSLDFDEKADRLWCEVYPSLSEGRAGVLGAVTGRAEAYVLRLAVTYALLDASEVIEEPHLRAALSLWRYAESSARHIFGDRLGDPDADAILGALCANSRGLTRTEIRDLFARNLSAERIERALALLEKNGKARRGVQTGENGGRPAETWFAVREGTAATTETT